MKLSDEEIKSFLESAESGEVSIDMLLRLCWRFFSIPYAYALQTSIEATKETEAGMPALGRKPRVDVTPAMLETIRTMALAGKNDVEIGELLNVAHQTVGVRRRAMKILGAARGYGKRTKERGKIENVMIQPSIIEAKNLPKLQKLEQHKNTIRIQEQKKSGEIHAERVKKECEFKYESIGRAKKVLGFRLKIVPVKGAGYLYYVDNKLVNSIEVMRAARLSRE